MKKLTKKIILFMAVFAFIFLGTGVTAEENGEEAEIREQLDLLIKKAQELAEIVEELDAQGKLPLIKTEKDYEPYLEEYIRYGADNNPAEVEKLQTFLNEYEGEEIPVTGFYGDITLEAVNRFQVKYSDEILAPWGIDEPTGYVYKTTQRKINDIKSPGVEVPMPELVPGTPAEDLDEEVIGEEDREVTEVTDEEEVDEEVDENDEEVVVDEEVDEEEREDDRNLAWTVIILGSIGLGIILYYIRNQKETVTKVQ